MEPQASPLQRLVVSPLELLPRQPRLRLSLKRHASWCLVKKLGGVWACLLMFCGFASHALASEASCKMLFKKKSYMQAAKCFRGLVQQVDQDPKQKDFATLLKDRFLRLSALSLRREAKRVKQPARTAYLLERAIEALQISVNERYCRAARRCRRNLLQIDALKKRIGYGTLVISSKQPKTQISVKGYQFMQTGRGSLTEQVRPGDFRVTIQFPGRSPQTRDVTVKPNGRVILDVTPTQIKVKERRIYTSRQVPPAAVGSYIAGGVLLVGGIIVGVLGILQQGEANNKIGTDQQSANYSDEQYQADRSSGQLFSVIGFSVAGAGVLLLGTAVVLQRVLTPKAPPKSPDKASSQLGKRGPRPTRAALSDGGASKEAGAQRLGIFR